MMEIISRKDAIAAGLNRYFTGKPCPRGHIAERKTGGACIECNRIYNQSEKAKERHKAYMKNNPDKKRRYSKKYYDKISALPPELRPKRNRKPETEKDKLRKREYMRERYRNDPAYARALNMKSTYGITPEQYDHMLAEQDGRCAICHSATVGNKTRNKLFIDHCHDINGAVRGLLCHHCNFMLGYAKDNPSTLRAAADYLERAASLKIAA